MSSCSYSKLVKTCLGYLKGSWPGVVVGIEQSTDPHLCTSMNSSERAIRNFAHWNRGSQYVGVIALLKLDLLAKQLGLYINRGLSQPQKKATFLCSRMMDVQGSWTRSRKLAGITRRCMLRVVLRMLLLFLLLYIYIYIFVNFILSHVQQ